MGRGRKFPAGSLVRSRIAAPCLAGGLYFLLSIATIELTGRTLGVSAIWPANAILLSMMALRPRGQWGSILLAGAAGTIGANCAVHGLSLPGLLFGAANLVEVTIAAWAITRLAPSREALVGHRSRVVRLALWVGIAAPAAAAIIGGSVFEMAYGKDLSDSALLWFFADSLGLMTFTPFFYALFSGEALDSLRDRSLAWRVEACLLIALTAGVSTVVFLAHRPLLFLITMPTMLVAFRMGGVGVRIASVIVAVIGCVATAAGHGPLAAMTPDPALRVLFLQVFLMAQLLIQWPVVGALAARDRAMEQLSHSERSLRFLASQSSVLMLTFDMDGICRKAVGAGDLLPHILVDAMPGLPVEALVRSAGAALRDAHGRAIDGGTGQHSAEFPIDDGAGGRWLEATFRAREDENGRCPGTVMTLHDISVRKRQAIALTRSAQTDSLTGLLNRAGFMKRLEREMAAMPGGALCLAMIDVDRFKLVNDNNGHQTGDLVLVEIARRIAGQLRSTDFVGRMGGDEFVVLLGGADWARAKDICARLVHMVGAEPVRLPSGRTIGTAISCGVARHYPGMTVAQFLNDADVALYEAKRGGRNQMVAA